MEQRDLLASMTMNQDLPGKVTHCRHGKWSDEKDITIMSKVARGKGKSIGEDGKIVKCAEKQDNESTDSFQIRGDWWTPGDCQCFCTKACIKKRKPRFKHYVWQILVWRRLLCLKSGRQRGAPPVPVAFTKEFVSFLGRNFLFFFFFLTKVFRPLLIFP